MLPEDEQKEAYRKLVFESGRAIAEVGLWYLDPRKASMVDASCITCPLLVVAGANDRIVPASIAKKIAAKYETVSTYREFKNHSHWLLGESGWEDIARFVANWLKS